MRRLIYPFVLMALLAAGPASAALIRGAALKSAGLNWSGAPVYSRYNPPITPWFLRRNEIWLELADVSAASGLASP